MIVAHILGLPIEETAPQLAQAGFVALIALQLIRGRMRRFFDGRGGRGPNPKLRRKSDFH